MKNKFKLKRTAAKEILILFLSALVIGLAWIIFHGINYSNITKAEELKEQISTLTHEINSANTREVNNLDKILLVNNLPKECFDEKGRLPLILVLSDSANQRDFNIYRLHKLLVDLKFPFYKDNFIPDLPNFKTAIEKELEIDTLKQVQLKQIYLYLKQKNYMTVSYKEFCLTLDFYKLLPTLEELNAPIIQRDELTKKLEDTKEKIYSKNDLSEIAKWITIITLTVVYPFRILILLLRWALKTVRQKQE